MPDIPKFEITKSAIEKLAYTKFLYEQGISNSTKAFPFSTVAILNYHDAIEFFLVILMEGYGIVKTDRIKECIAKLIQKGISLSGEVGVIKIVQIRNNLKHGILIPSIIQLTEATSYVSSFLGENSRTLLGMEFDEISTAQLIGDEEIKAHLLESVASFKSNDIDTTRYELSRAFWKTVNKYKDRSQDVYRMPFDFGQGRLKSAFFMGLTRGNESNPSDQMRLNKEFQSINEKFQEIGEFIDSSKESIESMRDAVEMLSLGIDYRKFAIFSQMIPHAVRSISGEYHISMGSQMAKSIFIEKDLHFCSEFIVECYFLLNN